MLAKRVVASLPSTGSVRVVCEGGGERHVVTSSDALAHDLVVAGLLADTDYACEIGVTEDGGEASTVILSTRTGSLPTGIPTMVLGGAAPEQSAGAYTLFNQFVDGIDALDQRLLVVDAQARVRWYYELGIDIAGDVDARYLGEGRVLWGGGYGGTPTIVDLAGETHYVAPPSSTLGNYHHHAELTDAGTLLSLVVETVEGSDGETWTGYAIDERDVETNDLLWTWSTQAALDRGDLPVGTPGTDPYHGNWAWKTADAVYTSLRGQHEVLKLDPDTGAVVWRLGYTGDFELLWPDGTAAPVEEWFYTQHAPEFDGDRVLIYDNGTSRPTAANYSRVVELELDEEAMTATVLWSWTEDPWQEPIWGDADRVGDGHVLIALGHCDDCSWTLEDGRSALIELDVEAGEVVWRIDFPDVTDGLYRAERLDACAIFGNATLCPGLEVE